MDYSGVSALAAVIGAEVDALLLGFGKDVTVYKASVGAGNLYGQQTKSFGTGVVCKGRCLLTPTEEQISLVGNLEEIDAAFVFARAELVRKFPAGAEGEWITELDEASFEGDRYKLVKVKPSGKVEDKWQLVVVLGRNILGKLRQ